jgi:hypothetical protein
MLNSAIAEETGATKSARATTSLRWAALFLGELRDGLTMVRILGSRKSFPFILHSFWKLI